MKQILGIAMIFVPIAAYATHRLGPTGAVIALAVAIAWAAWVFVAATLIAGGDA